MIDPVMRQEHPAGERTFVDHSGVTVDNHDTVTKTVWAAQICVAAPGASNYTFAEATWTQQLADWIASQVRMVECFGGVTGRGKSWLACALGHSALAAPPARARDCAR